MDSTWRRNSAIGGSCVAMQIATRGACGACGGGGATLALDAPADARIRIRASSASVVAPSARRARTPIAHWAPSLPGPMRAMPQKPLR
jgi:hypothetical protein